MQKQPPEKFCKKAVHKNFAILTGKHLWWRLFLIQNNAKFFRALIFEEHLRKAASEYVHETKKLKIVDKGFWLYTKKLFKKIFFQHQHQTKWKWVCLCFYFMVVVRNKPQTINIYTKVAKRKIKSSRKDYAIGTCFKFCPMENIFRKL